MSYLSYLGALHSRTKSYEHEIQQLSTFITREELEDAKKELSSLYKRRIEELEKIEKEKNERDEWISATELQELMFPVDDLNRRIEELRYLITNAQIVESSSRIRIEDIPEDLIDDSYIEQVAVSDDNIASSDLPQKVYFLKDGVKVEAKPGNHTPFYALVNNEYIGYNRLLLDGWVMVDDFERRIEDISKAWEIRNKQLEQERANYIQSAKAKYPNAYSPWTEEENKKLIDLRSNDGKTVDELSEILGRTPNGISYQLRRLLGVDKLPYTKKKQDLKEYSQNPISITSINPADIPDEQMPGYLDMIEKMEKWFKVVKDYAMQQAIENGVYYEGYEVKPKNSYSFLDTKKVMETIRTQFPDLFDDCVQLKPVSYIMKKLGEENYNASVAPYVEQSERNSLVKSTKRE